MRKVQIERNTTETRISARLDIDGSGSYDIKTGSGFLDHMLELFTRHGRFDLKIECKGDTYIDDHHTVEDVGIVLGSAFKKALGEKKGIVRYGSIMLPMDEALILVALDFSGRSTLVYDLTLKEKVGNFDTELVEEFFLAFVREAGLTLHIKQLSGMNSHHIIEGTFKGFARALAQAVEVKHGEEIPSTKGVL
ncbi:MAG: imidazoleglycerol-phosphate dehydratase HisB [Anaerovoracaceae bacterium]|jgi:imidazoleglycerol-phosphate dehydratase